MRKFKCENCGSTELIYQKYVRCITPVQIQDDGTLYYGLPEPDESDEIGAAYGFCCGYCGEMVEHCGFIMQTEHDLISYLKLSEEERQTQQSEYDQFEELKAQSMEEEQEAHIEEYLYSGKN